jgi:hypothetical protein
MRLSVRLGLLTLAFVGCDSGGPSADQACTDLATAHCNREQSCSAFRMQRDWGTVSSCIARRKTECLLSLQAPQTTDTAATKEACAMAYPTHDCPDVFMGVQPAVCIAPPGPRANGSPCSFYPQCQSRWCGYAYGAGCGVCGPVPSPGTPCMLNSDCLPSMVCQSNTNVCTVRSPDGTACGGGSGVACGIVSGCAGPKGQKTCQANITTASTACDYNNVTTAHCDDQTGLFCDFGSMTCKAAGFTTDGMTCTDPSPGPTVRCTDGSCFPGGNGTCKKDVVEGTACDTVNGPICEGPAHCVGTASGTNVTGTCQLATPTTCN